MKVFNCILGFFAILGGIYCTVFPGITFLNSGIILAILLGVMGLCSVFEFIANRKNKELLASGIVELILGIGSAVISILAIYSPAIRLMLDILVLMMFVCWLIYSGVTGIFTAVAVKKLGSKMWVFSLVMSILTILTGLFAASHLLFTVFAIGYMIGFGFTVYGLRLILSVFEKKE